MQDVLDREATTQTEPGEGYGVIPKALMGAAAGAVGTWALDRTDWRMWKHESEEARLRTNAVRPQGEPPAHVLVGRTEKALGLNPPRPSSTRSPAQQCTMASVSVPLWLIRS